MVSANHASSNRHLDEAPESFTMTNHLEISTSVSRISDTNRVQLGREGAPRPYEIAPFTSCTMINFFYFIHFGIYIVCCTIVIYATTCLNFFAIFWNTQFLTTTINKQTNKQKENGCNYTEKGRNRKQNKKKIITKRKETSSKFFQNFLKVNKQHVRHSLITYFCAASRLFEIPKF